MADEAGLRENIVLTGNLTYDTDGRVLIHSTVNSRRHHLYGPQLVVAVILTNFMARNKQTHVTKSCLFILLYCHRVRSNSPCLTDGANRQRVSMDQPITHIVFILYI